MPNMFISVALAMLLFIGPALADTGDAEIELGKIYSLQPEAAGGHYKEYLLTGLAKAKGVRLTLSVTKRDKTTRWLPSAKLSFDENRAVIEDATSENPLVSVVGAGAMSISLGFNADSGVKNEQTYKRSLAPDQKVNLEISWATPGILVVTIDGQERRQIALSRKIGVMNISVSSATVVVEDMIFK